MIPRADSWSRIRKVPAAYLLMQIRHNLVVGEKPFFRRGGCVLKTAYHLEKDETLGFLDEAVAGRFSSGGSARMHGT